MASMRLYVGNLSASVDEYSLIQVFAKHGKISKLDYLFHKTGPSKGKPRGYAFVEYETKEEALRAMVALHDKLIRGRKIVVTAASEQSNNPDDVRLAALSGKGRGTGRGADASRPTPISLLKGQGVAGASTNRKIAALEAKLASLRKNKPIAELPAPSDPSDPSEPVASTSALPQSGEEGAGVRWLESLVPGDGKKHKRAADGEDDDEDGEARVQEEVRTKNSGGAVEADEPASVPARLSSPVSKPARPPVSAGLPARPLFDAKSPPRRS